MAMKRTKTPWMKAEDFGRSLPKGIGINLLVPEIAPMEAFCRDVLGATIVYSDEDFAAVALLGSVFMLHADHSYSDNPMAGVIEGVEQRGTGMEIRIYGLDPDQAEARARAGAPCACRFPRQAAWAEGVPYRRSELLRLRAQPGDRGLTQARLPGPNAGIIEIFLP